MHSFLPKNFRACSFLLIAAFICLNPYRLQAVPSALNSDAAVQTATDALEKKNFDAALSALAPALQAHPDDSEILNLKGAILTKQQKYDAALVCFNQALKLSPGLFASRYNIGAVLALQHKWPQAIDYYRTLLIDQPNNELVEYKLLLLLLHENSDPELQSKLFATDLPTNTPAWYFATAARNYKKGNPADAEKYLQVAKNIYGDQIAIYQEELDESGLNASH